MEEAQPTKDAGEIRPVFKRPMILTAICLAAFVHFGLIALLFLLAAIRSERITQVLNKYIATGGYSGTKVFLLFASGFALHAFAFIGVYYIWKKHKAGYFILGISCLIIAIYQLFNPLASVGSTALYIGFLLLFGFFFRTMQ